MKKFILPCLLILASISAKAELTIEFQGAPPNMAACIPGVGEKYTVLAAYSVYYDLAESDPRLYQLKAYDSADKEITAENVQFNVPGFFANENNLDLRQFAGRGAFSFQVNLKGMVACKNYKIDMTQIHIKAVPITN
jgi:hypothetical protein